MDAVIAHQALGAFQAMLSFISNLKPYLPSRITSISATLAAFTWIADRHNDNELLGILACAVIPLLANNLPHGEPSVLIETLGFTIATAYPNTNRGYHTAIVYHWFMTCAQLNPHEAFAAMRAAFGVYTVFCLPLSAIIAPLLSRQILFLVVLALIISYRSLKSPAAAHGALPEGLNGIWSPIWLHAVKLFMPELKVQWFGYNLYFYGFCRPEPPGPWVLMYGSEAVNMEGMLTATAAWAFGTGQRIKTASETLYGPNPHRLFTRQSVGPQVIGWGWKASLQYFRPWYRNLRRGRSEVDIPMPFLHGPITTPNTIRLLRILPSLDNTKPINCEILAGRFYPTDSTKVYSGPKYTAISYCWDKPSSSPTTQGLPTVFIDSRPCQVQQTVYSILRSVRRPLSEYNIWIDSICINQSDDVEKAQQVQLMRLIYENASHVSGFLRGPSNIDPGGRLETTWRDLGDFWSPSRSNSSEYRAREMLGRITSTMHIHQEPAPLNHDSGRNDWRDPDIDPWPYLAASEEDWLALQTLITNPYFTRVWIIQEVVAARNITLNYGGQIIPWQLFARAMTIISSQGISTRSGMYFRHNKFKSLKPIELPGIFNGLVLENLRQWYTRPGFLTSPPVGSTKGMLSLEDTLKLCGRFEATREVDRIFALLGVAKDSDILGIKVDYRPDKVKDVFVAVAKRLMAKRIAGIDGTGVEGIYPILRFAGVAPGAKVGEEKSAGIEGLPSWVPDWTRRMDTAVLTHARKECQYRACGGMGCGHGNFKAKFIEGDRLLLKGVIVTQVEWLSPVFTGYPDEREESQLQFFNTILTAILRLSAKYESKYRYTPRGSEPESVADACWRTLFGNMTADARPGNLDLMKGIGSLILRSEKAGLRGQTQNNEAGLLNDLFKGSIMDGTGGGALEGKIALQLNDNPDNIFNHMLMTELSNANPKHKGGFTHILGTRKVQQSSVEHPIFALGRRFCITTDEHMGLVPATAKEGDIVAIFEGAPTPHILRRSCGEMTKKDGSIARIHEHELVGECYVHGIMDGEAVDGKDVKSKYILLR
ncbi:Heterokaryon incompatibility protein (HET) domain containing protein [Naviculisporaceae sp. PSN 640]